MSVLHQLTSEAATKINDVIPQACTPQQLDARLIWQGNGEGVIDDDDAS